MARGDLDRLADEGHAALVGAVSKMLVGFAWMVRIEVSYSIYGERGSIDILAWHPLTGTLLVVEVKTELTSIEETLRKHDQKVRLASRIAAQEFGWRSASAGRLLVLPDLATPRRRAGRHRAILDPTYALRGRPLRDWLRMPSGAMSGLLFLDPAEHSIRESSGRKRMRTPTRVA